MTDSDETAFGAAFFALASALQADVDNVQMRHYFKALRRMEIELLLSAAKRLIEKTKFFPKPVEWRDEAVKVEMDRQAIQTARIRERLKAGESPLCGQCEDTGWERLAAGVKRCDCQKLRRLEILGRRPMPALPEAP